MEVPNPEVCQIFACSGLRPGSRSTASGPDFARECSMSELPISRKGKLPSASNYQTGQNRRAFADCSEYGSVLLL